MARRSLKAIKKRARACGLFIDKYNPGDNLTYKVMKKDVDYFAASSSDTVARVHSLKAVEKVLDKHCGKR